MYYADNLGVLMKAQILEKKETHLRISLDNGFEMDFHEAKDLHILTPHLTEAYLFASKAIEEDFKDLLGDARNNKDKELSELKALFIKLQKDETKTN